MSKGIALVGPGKWGGNYVKTGHFKDEDVWRRNYQECRKWPAGVVVVTPTSTHFEVSKYLIEQGVKHLLVEKPLTATSTEAEELQSITQKHGAHIMVGHLMLYDPAVQEMFRLAGSPTTLKFSGLQSPVRTDASVLEDWGAHPLYLALHLFGNPIDTLATRESADNIRLTAKFPNKRTLTANIGWTSPERKRAIEISGPKGTLILDWSSGPKTLKFNGQPIDFPTSPSPLEAEIEAFKNFIETGQTITPLEQGIEVVKLIDKAEKSLHLGESAS